MKRMRSMLMKVCFQRCKNDHLQRTFDFCYTFIKTIMCKFEEKENYCTISLTLTFMGMDKQCNSIVS